MTRMAPQKTVMPKEDPSVCLYLYHPSQEGAKRIDLTMPSPEEAQAEVDRLKSLGWSPTRYAMTLYHRKYGVETVKDPKKVAVMMKAGWQEKAFVPANEDDAKTIHEEAIHPHWNDKARQIHLMQEAG